MCATVEDIDNDVVKCRWARNELGECAGVCQTFPGAILDEVYILYIRCVL